MRKMSHLGGVELEVLKVVNLYKSFRKKSVLNNFNLTIYKGEIFGLLGKNASGKSTFINIFSGLLKKDKGEILFFNNPPIYPYIFKKIAVARENPSFYPHLTLKENFNFFSKIYGNNDKIPDELNLKEFLNEKAGKLSRGTRQKLMLALTLWRDAEFFILDEPMAHLDPETRSFIEKRIKFLKEKNKTVLITTHREEDVEICDRVGILKNGKIEFIGSIKNKEIKNFFKDKNDKV